MEIAVGLRQAVRPRQKGPLDVPLGGDLLVEASAGTGKTYALTTLVARAVVEAELGVHQLLVVTFTVAATGELRSRIRRTLQKARAAYQPEGKEPSPQARQLLERWEGMGIDRDKAESLLARALLDLDRATVLTIHGLCQRLLTDFAFDGAIPFGIDVSGDDEAAVAKAVRDFWRRRVVVKPARLLEQALGNGFTPSRLAEWVGPLHPKANLDIRGIDKDADALAALFERKHAAWLDEFPTARGAWAAHGSGFLAALDGLRWRKSSQEKMRRVRNDATRAFEADDPGRLALVDAGYLGRAKLSSILLKGQALPDNPMLDHFDRLGEVGGQAERIATDWRRALRRDLLEDVRETLRATAWEERRLSFNALLTETARALEGPAGPAMSKCVRERFPLALVDEFQDTDGLQTDILNRIYPPKAAGASEQAAAGLIIVGDPKQSIFRFRGADVFAYLQAKQRVKQTRTLQLPANYRSTPPLVRAVNAIFKRRHPFLLPELGFDEARPAKANGGGLTLPEGCAAAPLQLRLKQTDAPMEKKDAMDLAAAGVASEIAKLLKRADADDVLLDGQPLVGGDIAVLVRTSAQGQATAAALRELGVRSVEMGDEYTPDTNVDLVASVVVYLARSQPMVRP